MENPEHNTLLFDSDIAIDLDDSDTHSQLLYLKKFFQSTTFYPDKTNFIRFIDSALDSYLREYSRLHGTTDKNTPISIDKIFDKHSGKHRVEIVVNLNTKKINWGDDIY